MSYAMSLLHTIIVWFLSPLTQIVPKSEDGCHSGAMASSSIHQRLIGKTHLVSWSIGRGRPRAGTHCARIEVRRLELACICLTTITDSGFSMGKKYLDEGLLKHVNYAPWDYPLAVHRYIGLASAGCAGS